jgi:hypothetical protein
MSEARTHSAGLLASPDSRRLVPLTEREPCPPAGGSWRVPPSIEAP